MSNYLIVYPTFSIAAAAAISEQYFGIKVKAKELVSYADQNFYLLAANGEEYTLKIMNHRAAKDMLRAQNAMMSFLHGKILDFDVPKVFNNLKGEAITEYIDTNGNLFYIRLLSWVKGDTWADLAQPKPELYEELGQKLAKMTILLQNFSLPYAIPNVQTPNFDAANVNWIYDKIELIEKEENKTLIKHFLDDYTKNIVPQAALLRNGFIQNDAHAYNVLVNTELHQVTGLIDFGEMVYSKIVCELAVACAYLCIDSDEPLKLIAPIVKGFNRIFPLNSCEIHAIFPLLINRIAISVSFSAINHANGIESEYVYAWEQRGWNLLHKLSAISPQTAANFFYDTCNLEDFKPYKITRKMEEVAHLLGA